MEKGLFYVPKIIPSPPPLEKSWLRQCMDHLHYFYNLVEIIRI